MLPAPKQPLKAPLRADPHVELVRLKEKIWQRYVSLAYIHLELVVEE